MSSALTRLVENSGLVAANGCLEDGCLKLQELIDAIIKSVSKYVECELNTNLSIMQRAAAIFDTYLVTEKVTVEDARIQGIYIEVITYLLCSKMFPAEPVCMRAVLMGSTLPGSPLQELDWSALPEQYNFALCYFTNADDDDCYSFVNKESYTDTKVYMMSSPLLLSVEREERKKNYKYSEV